MDFHRIAEKFSNFAVYECNGSSELYMKLSLQISNDKDVLKLCHSAREGQPIPNLLLGAVHYLLLKGVNHPLKEYYPSIVSQPKNDDHLFEVFKDFCFENVNEIKPILRSKLVQTNEVRRCAYLYPLFCYIHHRTSKPLSLIEIGTSAGLQLLWDQYSYSYGDEHIYGNKKSLVHLSSRVRKGSLPDQIISSLPPVNDRRGIDLHVSDLTDEEDYQWLKALIWPEHKERMVIFEHAVTQLKESPPPLLAGNGVELLTDLTKEIPAETTICVFHTHVANQMTAVVKEKLIDQINKIGEQRKVFHIYNNMEDSMLHVDVVEKGNVEKNIVGETDGHGRWFDWKFTSQNYNY
ncbi:DUF2332 domain-containing protein [Halobacillus sp. B23F22_1]|uniref:DUF2332 domain-containing protein n=1 Tax=Halobacillus sp. B23F22_1 TaxID=3459514 RepID=UPI00373E47AF